MQKTREEINRLQRERRQRIGNIYSARYEKTPSGFLMRKYRNMKSRVTGVQKKKHHLYAGIDLLDKEAFYEWSKTSKEFAELFGAWVESGYARKQTPSIDRIDPSLGYTIGNMQWITFTENSRRGWRWRPSEHRLTQYGDLRRLPPQDRQEINP
jgi:hypothetical protein